jgi:beta-phosphoglucomutase-like phosphatase (HAD superfamily)
MRSFKALLWDVDGALSQTERDGHRVAFNQAFADFGLPWHWSDERYGELLAITGGRERLLRDMSQRHDVPVNASARDALARQLDSRKSERYAEWAVSRPLALRGGVAALVDECLGCGVRLGIATTTSRGNIDVLLRSHWGEDWSRWFCVVVCGEDVQCSKPNPEAFVRALLALRVVPSDVVAIEDSPAGVAAARAVDIPVIVTRGAYFEHANFHGAIAVGPGLDRRQGWEPTLERCAGSVGRVELADIDMWASIACAPC